MSSECVLVGQKSLNTAAIKCVGEDGCSTYVRTSCREKGKLASCIPSPRHHWPSPRARRQTVAASGDAAARRIHVVSTTTPFHQARPTYPENLFSARTARCGNSQLPTSNLSCTIPLRVISVMSADRLAKCHVVQITSHPVTRLPARASVHVTRPMSRRSKLIFSPPTLPVRERHSESVHAANVVGA